MIVYHEYQWSSIVIRSDDLKSSVLSCKGSKRQKSSDTINLFVSINLIFIRFYGSVVLTQRWIQPFSIFLILGMPNAGFAWIIFNSVQFSGSLSWIKVIPMFFEISNQLFKMQLTNDILRFSLFPELIFIIYAFFWCCNAWIFLFYSQLLDSSHNSFYLPLNLTYSLILLFHSPLFFNWTDFKVKITFIICDF